MKKYKKIISIFVWIILVAGIVVCESFASKKQDRVVCGEPDITIEEDGNIAFLDRMDVLQLLKDRGDSITGQLKSSVNIPKIERALNEHQDIANAEVSMSIEGIMKIKIKQRKPVIRIINKNDEEYYIDETGRLMPLSEKYTPKVLIANGNILEPYAANYLQSVYEISKDTLKKSSSVLDDLFALAMYVNADKFWKAQIQQVFVNDEKEMVLIPLVGNHKIIFGDTTALDEKFRKLKTFYLEGLNPTGNWEKYSTINLKYKNQIVCTKK